MKKRPWFAVLYMFVLSAFFSAIVIGLARATRPRVTANERIAFERAVLEALPLALPPGMPPARVHALFNAQIAPPDPTSAGAYRLMADGTVAAYALPLEGQGFWAPIRGVAGVAADRTRLTGLAFFEQNETPGLGAEIAEPRFRAQFENKPFSARGHPFTFRRSGEPVAEHEVHAITGATQTSRRLERMLNEQLRAWLDAMATNAPPRS
ncbi:MAG: FMN-binding protein [Kiritimatiellae bacterium]|nr:FMN-binding protein [Kiritimatiellia bacterium]